MVHRVYRGIAWAEGLTTTEGRDLLICLVGGGRNNDKGKLWDGSSENLPVHI